VPGGFDAVGAVLVTASMLLLIFTLVKAPDEGWGAAVLVPSHVNWRMSCCTSRYLVLRLNEPGGDAASGGAALRLVREQPAVAFDYERVVCPSQELPEQHLV
jgi:hypothetical protein